MLVTQYTVFAQPKVQNREKTPTLEYYMVIIKNNLFKPLGFGDEIKRQEFVLTGILGSIALIQAVGQPNSYYLTAGETFANGAKLTRIGEDSVTIFHEGNKIELKLGSGVSDSPEGRKGSGPRTKSSRSNKQVKGNRGAESKRMAKNSGKRQKQEVNERNIYVNQKLNDLNNQRGEIKKKIMIMEKQGHTDKDAYIAIKEIDYEMQELKSSSR